MYRALYLLYGRVTKRDYYQTRVRGTENSGRALWGIVAELTNRNTTHHNITLRKDDGSLAHPKDAASALNNFFINSALDTVQNLPGADKIEPRRSPDAVNSTMYITPFAELELDCLLQRKLKNKKSSGPDGIPDFILQRILRIVIQPLTFLVNMSLREGVFPDKLKVGRVTLIHKGDDRQAMRNYRPVTILNSLSKVFEYAFLDRLMAFIYKYNMNSKQHGFSKSRSTFTALVSFCDLIAEGVDAGGCPASVFRDLSRAFDCVDHRGLIHRLYNYGIRGVASGWISSFLSGRRQYVSLRQFGETIDSKMLATTMGVPQGSIMGPILFALYVNDLDLYLDTTPYVSYADDFALILSFERDDDCVEARLKTSITNTAAYFNQHSLHFNFNYF